MSCVVLLQLKGKVSMFCVWTPIKYSLPVFFCSLLFSHLKLFYMLFFLFFVLTLISVGFLQVRFEVKGEVGVGKINLCLKLVRFTLEPFNLLHGYKHTFSFRKYIF